MRVTVSVLVAMAFFCSPCLAQRTTGAPLDHWVAVTGDDPLSDPHVKEMVNSLWLAGRLGTICNERGAWILRDSEGRYSCQQVPTTSACKRLTFSGEIPRDAVAFIHTHPNSSAATDPQDWRAARQIGLPMYTLHRTGVWMFDPATSKTIKALEPGTWQSASADGCDCAKPLRPGTAIARKKGRRDAPPSVISAGATAPQAVVALAE